MKRMTVGFICAIALTMVAGCTFDTDVDADFFGEPPGIDEEQPWLGDEDDTGNEGDPERPDDGPGEDEEGERPPADDEETEDPVDECEEPDRCWCEDGSEPTADGECDTREPVRDPFTGDVILNITDTTEGPEGCDVADPGSDIFGAQVEDSRGNVIAQVTEVVHYEPGRGENHFQEAEWLFGENTGEATCPDFDESRIVSLGCGGQLGLGLEFTADADPALGADQIAIIRVMEYGAQCRAGTDADTYSVAVCGEAVEGLSDNGCIELGRELQGETAIEIDMAGLLLP